MKKLFFIFALIVSAMSVSAQTIYECCINDPDGYTNVRKSQSASSAIVGRFNNGEIFYARNNGSNWWPVYYSFKGSAIGYMHKSRIRIIRTVSTGEKINNGVKSNSATYRRAIINDPDGYTNIRKGPSSNTAIVGRINDGQIFYYGPGSGNWYKVYRNSNGGFMGYMHNSRIRNY